MDNDEKRKLARKDWKKGMKYKEIAEKYQVSLSCVKSWASRYWKKDKVASSKKKVATKRGKKSQPSGEESQPRRPPGAPLGNRNAVGNCGGAPIGNKNNYKHGLYETVYWDTLTEDEIEMLQGMGFDEEGLLKQQIALLTVRERRLLKSIETYRGQKSGSELDSVVKRKLKIQGNVLEDDFQKQVETTTKTLPTFDVIYKLETELSRVQAKKTKCIEALNKIRMLYDPYVNSLGTPAAAADPLQEDAEAVVVYIPENGRKKE